MKKWLLFLLIQATSLFAAYPPNIAAQVLYYIHQGQIERGINCYLDYSKESHSHDFELLQQAAYTLLEEGSRGDVESQMMCLFGSGVSLNDSLLPILEKGIHSTDMKQQLAALNFLSRFQDDAADDLLIEALSSPFLLTRLESSLQLAQKKHPKIFTHIESLLVKLPPPIRVLFPQIVAPLKSPEAARMLRQLMSDEEAPVRCEAILQAAEYGYDTLIPHIRKMAAQRGPAELESSLVALHLLKDEESLPLFQKWGAEVGSPINLVAQKALKDWGYEGALPLIEKAAAEKNLFAISLLGDTTSSKKILCTLLEDPDRSVRCNATLRLLEMKDPICLPALVEILTPGPLDMGYHLQSSPGKGLSFWKALPNVTQKTAMYPQVRSETLKLRQQVLIQALEFSEEEFLQLVKAVFNPHYPELVPAILELLCNKKSEKVIEFLKEKQQSAGAPFIRNYCNLTLYKLKVEGPYEDLLLKWVREAQKTVLIRFQEEKGPAQEASSYLLTPEETSQLLINAFEALASSQNEKGIEALLQAIACGNPKNRYALAGLLMRTAE